MTKIIRTITTRGVNNMDKENKAGFTGVFLGGVFGTLAGLILGSQALPTVTSYNDYLQRFERQDGPAVVRFYRQGRDDIFVEEGNNHYTPLEKYLQTGMQNQADRDIEEARIKKTVKWYEE